MIDDAAKTLLVRMLACFEAPWAPHRQHLDQMPAICARRRGEIRLGIGGGRESQRQAYARQRDALTAAGLIAGNRLTAEGKRRARAWSWFFERRELIKACQRIKRLVDRRDILDTGNHLDASMVPETLVCGVWWGQQLALLQRCALPLLADEVLFTCTCPSAHCYYGFTSLRVNIKEAVYEAIGPGGGWSEELAEAYQKEYLRCRQEMLADSTHYTELGELPVGLGLLVSRRDQQNYAGIKLLFPYAPNNSADYEKDDEEEPSFASEDNGRA